MAATEMTVTSHPIHPTVSATGEISEPLYSLLREAADDRATDIHLDTTGEETSVRFRVDGMIHQKRTLQEEERQRILTQVKVAAGLSIDRSFVSEEGTIIFEHEGQERRYDIRVSIVPTGLERDAVHFRFLSGKAELMDLTELGMSDNHRRQLQSVLDSPTGIVIVAGVTGSGKSSTQYAIANALDLRNNVGVSIEDPIEMYVKGLRQIEVDYEHGFLMPDGLRVLLRMDPDAVFVGEIRDRESAITTARAGIAGRLVVATLHAPDPATAVEALQYYEVPNYITASGLRLIITQYLLRRICGACATREPVRDEERELFEKYAVTVPDHVMKAQACEACRRYGYKGRVAVFELTNISMELSRDIAAGKDKISLLQRFRELGGSPVLVDALEKAGQGVVSMADVTQLYLNLEKR